MRLMPHQIEALALTKDNSKVAYYYDMGLGKTYIGSEKAISLHKNILVVCQKSKVNDWLEHFKNNYKVYVFDLTKKDEIKNFRRSCWYCDEGIPDDVRPNVGIINYDLLWRRKELSTLTDFTLMLDESSLIQNEKSKRSKFVLNQLKPDNIILLSGTPTSGKYEKLWSQMKLLGWNISKTMFYNHYVDYHIAQDGYLIIDGYKNVERLKAKMREYGCVFKKSDEVLDLPKQNFIDIKINSSKEYKKFHKESIITVDDVELVGTNTLTKLLHERELCSMHSKEKLEKVKDLIESTEDRIVIFYNFKKEYELLKALTDRPISTVNGDTKDLSNYEKYNNSITLVQYQSGAMGINLQKANKIIYYSATLSSELFEQSKKRIHRIGQDLPCFYYLLKCGIEHKIYNALEMRKNYTEELFKEALTEDYLF